jgi:hypothetical protein
VDVGVDDRSTRYIICHRPEQADRDLTQHTDVMAGLHTEFEADREGAQNLLTQTPTAKRKAQTGHTKSSARYAITRNRN